MSKKPLREIKIERERGNSGEKEGKDRIYNDKERERHTKRERHTHKERERERERLRMKKRMELKR